MRVAFIVFSLVCGAGAAVAAQEPGPDQSSANYTFTAGTGLLVFHVRPERSEDFEAVMARVTVGLKTLTAPTRREQATGWRLFRARQASDAAVYVVLADPAVPEADYDPVRLMTELAPTEAPELYERLKAAVIRVERLDLETVP